MNSLLVRVAQDGAADPASRHYETVGAQAQNERSLNKNLVDRIIFGRWWIPETYHFTIAVVVLIFALAYWTDRLRRICCVNAAEKPTRWRRDPLQCDDRTPLLESLESKARPHWSGRLECVRLRTRAVLMYQPLPIPVVNKIFPSNSTTLVILLFLAINLIYLNYYTGSTFALWTACIMDRAGMLFVTNLPWLYLVAAKNQPLRVLTGHSYESLNILHRRLGEWMCLLAIAHVAGFFAFWWYWARPLSEHPVEVLWGWLTQNFVLVGIPAFVCYEILWTTSLASFRQWWYECFLASHVVLQASGLVLLFFHHPAAKKDALAALAIFVVDRTVYRIGLKSRTMLASLNVLEDGETMLLSADWQIPSTCSKWRRFFGKDIMLGWKPLEHVFLTVPDLGRNHRLQAHPFTIASAAPENNQQHAWLSLIIRARDGFTKDLLHHARVFPTTRVRFDGPYGSQHAVEMLQESDTAILVAGGSGIAVAYPVIWSLLHAAKAGVGHVQCKSVSLIWVVRESSHISWIGMERLDELRELGLCLVLPEPTAETGRPNVQRLLVEAIDEALSVVDGDKVGVVVSAPDAMNRDVNNTCARLAWEGREINVAVEKFGW